MVFSLSDFGFDCLSYFNCFDYLTYFYLSYFNYSKKILDGHWNNICFNCLSMTDFVIV